MQLLLYLFSYPFIWVISKLSFRLLYVISDGVFLLLYYVVGYRKKVVRENLRLTLHGKTEKEYKQIEKSFYRHFCDIFFETIHSLNVSKSVMMKRFRITNPEMFEVYKSQSIMHLSGHYGNWEWLGSLNYQEPHKFFAVYTKVENKYFEKLMKGIRQSYGNSSAFERALITEVMFKNKKENILSQYIFVSDQSPMLHMKRNYWRPFLNIPVPCFSGYETLARKLDLAVMFLDIKKVGRGYYEITLIPITDQAKSEEPYAILNKFYDLLEAQIIRKPEFYLWTHRRWKHRHHAKKFYKEETRD